MPDRYFVQVSVTLPVTAQFHVCDEGHTMAWLGRMHRMTEDLRTEQSAAALPQGSTRDDRHAAACLSDASLPRPAQAHFG